MDSNSKLIVILLSSAIILMIVLVLAIILIVLKKKKTQDNLNKTTKQLDTDYLTLLVRNAIEEQLSKKTESLINLKDDALLKIRNELQLNTEKTTQKLVDLQTKMSLIDKAQTTISESQKDILTLEQMLQGQSFRGTFGELTLNTIVTYVFGEQKHLYAFQHQLSNNSRVDLAIFAKDPLNTLCIDSKFPYNNYKRIFDDDNLDKKASIKDFKTDVKKHIKDIHDKYILANETADFAIMFIPAESVFSYILSNCDEIVEEAIRQNIVISSPTTLTAILKTIYMAIKNIEQSKKAKELQVQIFKLSTEFSRYIERFASLTKAFETVDRIFKELEVTHKKILNNYKEIDNIKE